ncbi:NnrU family protein [Thalassorhabdomicrobium marinisediminis]|uniref:NnrU family protein n=1 Tax=Thalassorhabdomicrobium marinisediminis TaxID=2170577 RepID=UPI00248F5FC6|nr:NnrU family protein [Thalassorhabdomicrobium marinisediminis]
MSWLGFGGVFAAFFLTHSIPVRPAVKSRLTAWLGPRAFTIGYSLLSLAMLALLIWAAGRAPSVSLWPQMMWQRHLAHLGMLAVCLILAASLARPNPFSFGGARNDRFDPAHPGILRIMRHPVLVALALWAGVHLVVNGDLAHVILFGVLGSFAVLGRKVIDRRKQRVLGPDRWQALLDATQAAPLFSAPQSWAGAGLRLLAGLAAFVALLALHPIVIGVAAL